MNKYIPAIFKSRPNRFIAEVEINGELAIAHVPNTGRCKELLVEGAMVYLMPSDNPNRKTKYSLHFVENKGVLVSIFSQQANSIVYDAICDGKIKELLGYDIVKREKTVGNSRIDIYLSNSNCGSNSNSNDCHGIENNDKTDFQDCFIEVKGVTLVKNKIAIFPDAPTERGTKHLNELIELKKNDHRAVVFFLIQHPNGNSFKPNWETDPVFSETLVKANNAGVEILVYKCKNSLDEIEIEEISLKYNLKCDKIKNE